MEKIIQSLTSDLSLELLKLVEMYGEGQRVEMRTVKWRSTTGLGFDEGELGAETDQRPHLSGKYFLSR